jgi:hypothetical protein
MNKYQRTVTKGGLFNNPPDTFNFPGRATGATTEEKEALATLKRFSAVVDAWVEEVDGHEVDRVVEG